MCSGALGSRYNPPTDSCVQGSPGSACDLTNKTTCYVGRFQQFPEVYTIAQLIEAGGLPSAEIKWDLQPGIPPALVEYSGVGWQADGLLPGDRIISIGNSLVTEAMLADLHTVTCSISVVVARGPVVVNLTLCGSE